MPKDKNKLKYKKVPWKKARKVIIFEKAGMLNSETRFHEASDAHLMSVLLRSHKTQEELTKFGLPTNIKNGDGFTPSMNIETITLELKFRGLMK